MHFLLVNNISFCILSLLLYFFSPESYSYEFCFLIFLMSLYVSFIYLIRSVKREGMGFSYLFIFSFLMVNFIYPVFYFTTQDRYFLSFNYNFNENVINQSTSIAFIALNFFILFNTNYNNRKIEKIRNFYINKNIVYAISFILTVIFIFFVYQGGYSDLFLRYSLGQVGYTGLNNYMFMFINFYTILLTIIGLHLKDKKLKFLALFISFLSSFLFLLTGYRSLFISIVLILFCYFNLNIRKIKLHESIFPIFIGGISMYFIMLYRGGEDFEYNNLLDIFSDLIINNWSLYVLTDYTNNFGSVLWLNFIPQALSIFPFSGSVLNSFNINTQYSYGQFPTYLAFGSNPPFGLGTNMVGEALLAFNIFGVVIVFSILGYLIKRLSYNLNKNFYFNIIFMYLVSQSIFLARADFGWPIKAISWMLLTYFILNFLFNKLSAKSK
ncbi:O-antigen polymerase [Acinetobacter sp. YH12025]|uniref:O-antigen polymerase n=1 Tax=Acinetobacter sp. YH12025 TaxID=2601042 RepID=UPI0015D1726A|nr:O-antigen polymerase [Acinetobacter sp. YH12025]